MANFIKKLLNKKEESEQFRYRPKLNKQGWGIGVATRRQRRFHFGKTSTRITNGAGYTGLTKSIPSSQFVKAKRS